jgi:hypothetical protein
MFTLKARCAIILAVLSLASSLRGADDYKLGEDSMVHEGVPRGEVTKYKWQSKIFPETVRDYWTYVPKQYDGSKAACLMVFQSSLSDGLSRRRKLCEQQRPVSGANRI